MIAKTRVYGCRNCGSPKIVKNGHNAYGRQQFWCKDCSKRGVLEPKHSYSAEQKDQILSAYTHERSSMRGIQRTFGVSRNTLTSWLKKRRAKSKDLKRRFCLHNQRIFSKRMKCGLLRRNTGRNAGLGL